MWLYNNHDFVSHTFVPEMAEAVPFYSVPRLTFWSVHWTALLPRQQDLCLGVRLQVNWSHSLCILLHSCVGWLFRFWISVSRKWITAIQGTSTLLVAIRCWQETVAVLVIKVGPERVGNQFAVLRQTFVVTVPPTGRATGAVCPGPPV